MIFYEKIVACNKSKECIKCMVCNHYYSKDNFDHQPYVCNNCHDFSMTVMDLNDFFILTSKSNDYRVYTNNIDKKEVIKEYYK